MSEDDYTQAAEAALNQPGLSIADGRSIDKWKGNGRLREERHVKGVVQQRRKVNAAKLKDVLGRLNDLQDAFVTVRKQSERGNQSPVDLAKALRKLNGQRVRLEHMATSLEQNERTLAAMEADPIAYQTDFFSRFPTLKSRRPDLAADLAEDRRHRGQK